MYVCYVDEAGCPGMLPSPTSQVQPVLVLAALILDRSSLPDLTRDFLKLKHRFNPNLRRGSHWLEMAKCEIKGSDLRSDVRKGRSRRTRAVYGFLDRVLDLIERADGRLLSRIYIKAPGQAFKGKQVYTASMQALCASYQRFLEHADGEGMIIADSRTPNLNSDVSHSVFTQRFKVGGDPFPRIVEMPTFGHSENHAALQITDILCSALLSPMATSAFCSGVIKSCHVHPADHHTRLRYADRVRQLGFRYHEAGRWRGGITVADQISKRPPSIMFAGATAYKKADQLPLGDFEDDAVAPAG